MRRPVLQAPDPVGVLALLSIRTLVLFFSVRSTLKLPVTIMSPGCTPFRTSMSVEPIMPVSMGTKTARPFRTTKTPCTSSLPFSLSLAVGGFVVGRTHLALPVLLFEFTPHPDGHRLDRHGHGVLPRRRGDLRRGGKPWPEPGRGIINDDDHLKILGLFSRGRRRPAGRAAGVQCAPPRFRRSESHGP